MSTHPAEVNEALAIAYANCKRLIESAEKRGDIAGADAWLVALRSIEAAEQAMRDARMKQSWCRVPFEAPVCARLGGCGATPGNHAPACPLHERT